MRGLAMVLALAGTFLCGPARAYEYPLQFGSNYGARGLVIAGYVFNGATVVGNCSYHVISGGGSGRGGGYHSHTTYYNQTCTWDTHGNLLRTTQGAPVVPSPLSTSGGVTTYARNAQGDTTGFDGTRGIGFVNTPSAQFAWVTQPSYVSPPDQRPVRLTLTLQSDGDFPLVVGKVEASALLAKVAVTSTTCQTAPVPAKASCAIVVTYDGRVLPSGDDPYTAYDTLTVRVVSNSGPVADFVEPVSVPVAPGG